jgi:ABC-2 type transport system ATP-binding protein
MKYKSFIDREFKMIQVENLSKSFESSKGQNLAVNDVSFTVHASDVLAFLGPNAAGKSTTMKMMTGFLKLSSGTVKFGSLNILTDAKECQKHISYVPENAPLYSECPFALNTSSQIHIFTQQVMNQIQTLA